MEESKGDEPQIKKNPWLHAWADPVASIKSYSSCLRLADLNDDGEQSLICVDWSNKLKVYKGTNVSYED